MSGRRGGGVSEAAAGLPRNRRTRIKMNENAAMHYEPIHVFMYTKEAEMSLHSSGASHNSAFMVMVHT